MAEDSVLGRMRLESKFVPGNVGTASWPIKACHARETSKAQEKVKAKIHCTLVITHTLLILDFIFGKVFFINQFYGRPMLLKIWGGLQVVPSWQISFFQQV